LIQTPSLLVVWFQRYNNSCNFKNNEKHKNFLPLLPCNSKSIFPTSDSFPLIMSHIVICSTKHTSFHTSIQLDIKFNFREKIFTERKLRNCLNFMHFVSFFFLLNYSKCADLAPYLVRSACKLIPKKMRPFCFCFILELDPSSGHKNSLEMLHYIHMQVYSISFTF